MVIKSRDNPLIKEAAALVSDIKARKATGLFVAEGARLCSEAAKSGAVVLRVFITEEAEKRYPEYVKDLLETAEEVFYITESVAEKISDTKAPQGVFAVCRFLGKRAGAFGKRRFRSAFRASGPGKHRYYSPYLRSDERKGSFPLLLRRRTFPEGAPLINGLSFQAPGKSNPKYGGGSFRAQIKRRYDLRFRFEHQSKAPSGNEI